jgi:hypothetical protein
MIHWGNNPKEPDLDLESQLKDAMGPGGKADEAIKEEREKELEDLKDDDK